MVRVTPTFVSQDIKRLIIYQHFRLGRRTVHIAVDIDTPKSVIQGSINRLREFEHEFEHPKANIMTDR